MQRRRRQLICGTASAAGALILAFAPAAAQTLPPTVATDRDIVVTGYRYLDEDTSGTTNLPLPIEQVPQSISLVNSDFLREVDLKTIAEVAQYTTGALFAREEPAYGSTAKLRGFRAGYAIDGLPVGDFLIEPDVATIDRLEVVKGPSSVVYGASNPGGLINLVTKGASPGARSYVYAQGGSWDRWRIEGQLAGSLNAAGTVRALVVGAHEEADGFVHFTDRNRSVGHAAIDADLAPGVTAYLRGSYQRQRQTAFDGYPAFADGTLPPIGRRYFIGAKDVDQVIKTARVNGGIGWEISPTWSVNLDGNYQDVRRSGGNTYVYTLRSDGLVDTWGEKFDYFGTKDANVAATTVLKLDEAGLPGSFVASSIRYQYFKYGIREVFATSQFNLFAGEDALSDHLQTLYDTADNRSLSQRRLRYLTASTQAVIKPVEQVSILAGLSYSDPKSDARIAEGGPWVSYNPGGEVSLRGAVTVEPVAGLNIYGSYSESFQPQNRIDVNNDVLPPLEGAQYEVGAKYVTPDRRLLLTAALFDLEQSNQQVFDQRGADGFDRYKPLGKVRHRGAELEATGQLTDRWQLRGGVALLDAEVRKDANPLIVGRTRPYLPKTTANAYTSYSLDNGLFVGAGVRYVGAVRTAYDNSTRRIASYTLADASVGYARDGWRLQLNIKNAFDDSYYVSGYETLDYSITPGEPRSFIVSLRRDF